MSANCTLTVATDTAQDIATRLRSGDLSVSEIIALYDKHTWFADWMHQTGKRIWQERVTASTSVCVDEVRIVQR